MQEIKNSRALQVYGALLALTHLLSSYFWMDRSLDLVTKASPVSASLCWPFFPACDVLRFGSSGQASMFLEAYAMVAVVVAGLFIFRRLKAAYVGLIILLLAKVYFTSLSYGLMGNYHYMTFFTHLAFLFLPLKTTTIPIFIGVFYWGAGILKFDPEWLSGTALITPTFLPPALEHLGLIYCVILECIFVFGLFSENKWIRGLVFLQFVLFHAFSWHVVGYFYPMTMLLLLGIFVLMPLYKETWQALWDASLLRKRSVVVTAAILTLLQIAPSVLAGDPAASGAPRILSLNMLDARMECDTLMIRHAEHSEETYDPFVKAPSTRTQCDPLVFLSQIKLACKDKSEKMDFWLSSRRTTGDTFKTRLFLPDVCSKSANEILWAEIL
ncbi:MAG: hypothetical protein OM95_12755 [Bdellovibrio sp. ArHS]|nr:MAG: hypothetical protein OM95_12755 [Bdellovibrio sp. ArHS]